MSGKRPQSKDPILERMQARLYGAGDCSVEDFAYSLPKLPPLESAIEELVLYLGEMFEASLDERLTKSPTYTWALADFGAFTFNTFPEAQQWTRLYNWSVTMDVRHNSGKWQRVQSIVCSAIGIIKDRLKKAWDTGHPDIKGDWLKSRTGEHFKVEAELE